MSLVGQRWKRFVARSIARSEQFCTGPQVTSGSGSLLLTLAPAPPPLPFYRFLRRGLFARALFFLGYGSLLCKSRLSPGPLLLLCGWLSPRPFLESRGRHYIEAYRRLTRRHVLHPLLGAL